MSETENVLHIDDNSFAEKTKEGVVLIDFYADWCGPCRMLSPVLEELAKEMQGKVVFAKVDIDKNQKTAGGCQVTSVPTMILFKDGKEVNRLIGLRDSDGIKQFLESVI